MRDVVIAGVGMHPFGKFLDKSLEDLARVAVWNAVGDSGVPPKEIQAAYVANSLGGLVTGQEGVRGQVILRDAGFSGIPIINVENACASGTTALRCGWMEVALGIHDAVLVLGVEKLFLPRTADSIRILMADAEVRLMDMGFQFIGWYAMELRKYMASYGWNKEHFARVVEKNSFNGSLNPNAQHRKPLSVEQVLNSRLVADPLTLYMCAPMSDGAAAAVLCSRERAGRYTARPLVEIAAIGLQSGRYADARGAARPSITTLAAKEAYERAGLGPEDVDVAEVHDAVAPSELYHYEDLGFCGKGEGAALIEAGRTKITGDLPVNTSGGLAARGHPVAATGLAQVAEIVWQLRGEAGPRQVADPKVGLVENTGGIVEDEAAVATVTLLKR
ncbi:MAG: thiolase family protein [Nitrospinota bacterium]